MKYNKKHIIIILAICVGLSLIYMLKSNKKLLNAATSYLRKPSFDLFSTGISQGDDNNHVTLVVGIASGYNEFERRVAIRNTWLKVCKEKHLNVLCRFFTDRLPKETQTRQNLIKEEEEHGDIEFLPTAAGMNFALRLLSMAKYFLEKYTFDFMLRVDDDYFVCLDRLVSELPYRQGTLYWGWFHCRENSIVLSDLGFLILTQDFVQEVLSKFNTTLRCYPYGGWAVKEWVLESKLNITYFMDNERLAHSVTSYQGDKFLVPRLCDKYLGLHGTYPDYMYKYWDIYNSDRRALTNGNEKSKFEIPEIPPFKSVCEWKGHPVQRDHGKPCKGNPDFRKPFVTGREKKNEKKKNYVL